MTLLSVGGVRFRVNALFLLLLFGLAWAERLAEGLTVFAVVLLHELGHVAAAKGYGVGVEEVELLPFGGVARLSGPVELDPAAEAGIAVAGPFTNLALMAAGALLWRYDVFSPWWTRFFLEVNALVAGVNLLPALPLDGGRLLRAHRSRKVGWRRATAEAVRLGRALAVVFTAAGAVLLYLGVAAVTLPVLGVFVFIAAGKEEQAAAYLFMAYLSRKRERLLRPGCMSAEMLAAAGAAPIKHVVERMVPDKYHLVWVVDEDGRPAGIASERDILDALFEHGPELPLEGAIGWRFIDRK